MFWCILLGLATLFSGVIFGMGLTYVTFLGGTFDEFEDKIIVEFNNDFDSTKGYVLLENKNRNRKDK